MKKMYTLSMYIQSLDMLLVKHQPERPIEPQEIVFIKENILYENTKARSIVF